MLTLPRTTAPTWKAVVALVSFASLVLLAKTSHARHELRVHDLTAPVVASPTIAMVTPVQTNTPSLPPRTYDVTAAQRLVGHDFLFMAEMLHRRPDYPIASGSIEAQFDEVFAVWAPEAVTVLRVERQGEQNPYRIILRTHSSGEVGYFEVTDLHEVNHYLALSSRQGGQFE